MTRTGMSLLIVNVAWSVHLVVSYYLAWAACTGDDGWLLALRHLATIVAVALALAALSQAYGALAEVTRQLRGHGDRQEVLAEHGYLARLTLLLGVIFLLGILMAGTANLFLWPCR